MTIKKKPNPNYKLHKKKRWKKLRNGKKDKSKDFINNNSLPNIEVIREYNLKELEMLDENINSIKTEMGILIKEKEDLLSDIRKFVKKTDSNSKDHLKAIEKIESNRHSNLLEYNKKINKTQDNIKNLTKDFLKRGIK